MVAKLGFAVCKAVGAVHSRIAYTIAHPEQYSIMLDNSLQLDYNSTTPGSLAYCVQKGMEQCEEWSKHKVDLWG